MALDIQPRFSISPRWSAIADLSSKTKGWVMGNPYLDSKWSGSIGFSFKTL